MEEPHVYLSFRMKALACIFVCCAYLVQVTNPHFFSCRYNEVMTSCKRPCERTCRNPYPSSCPSAYVCRPGCVCRDGSVRDEESGQCISPQFCHSSSCGSNEIPSSSSGCEHVCPNQNGGHCGSQSRNCMCKSGYVRDLLEDRCIFVDECPSYCDDNTIWKKCSDSKCRATCQRRQPKRCTSACVPGCVCRGGFLWDEIAKKCVRPWKCTKSCDKNEEWCQYLPEDIPTCQALLDPQCSDCAPNSNLINIQMRAGLKSGCMCVKGYIWDEVAYKCIRIEECHQGSSTHTPTENTTTSGVLSSSTALSSTTTRTTSHSTSTTKSTTESSSVSSTTATSASTSGTTLTTSGTSSKSTTSSASSISTSSDGTTSAKSTTPSGASTPPKTTSGLTSTPPVSGSTISHATTPAGNATTPGGGGNTTATVPPDHHNVTTTVSSNHTTPSNTTGTALVNTTSVPDHHTGKPGNDTHNATTTTVKP